MSEENIIEIRLTDEQAGAFAAILRAAHAPNFRHKASIMTVVTDSYVPESDCTVLRLQVAVVPWNVGSKIAATLTKEALPVKTSIFA
jgi:hypothetical protein